MYSNARNFEQLACGIKQRKIFDNNSNQKIQHYVRFAGFHKSSSSFFGIMELQISVFRPQVPWYTESLPVMHPVPIIT